VETRFITRDLAVLTGPDQKWLNTQDFPGEAGREPEERDEVTARDASVPAMFGMNPV
jgi:hypothetical protein